MPPEALGALESAVLQRAQIAPGSRILDLGCGTGDLTLELLALGAQVTAIDLSTGMLALAEQRVRAFGGGRRATFVATAVERLDLDSDAFDIVVGRFILHHLEIARAAPEIARVLRSGGRAVFAENSAHNPILMAARRHVAGRFGIPRLGTDDERPLSAEDVDALRPYFDDVQLSYPVFEFLRIFDRQVLRFRHARVSAILAALDAGLGRLRWMQPYSFRVVVTLVAR